MSDTPSSPPLFAEFPPVPTEEWEARIARDLEGADPEKLLWQLADDLVVRPFYRQEDLAGLPHRAPGAGSVDVGGRWIIQQNILAADPEEAASQVGSAIKGGVECIGLELRSDDAGISGIPLQDVDDLGRVIPEVALPETAVHLDAGPFSPALLAMLLHECDTRGVPTAELRGSLGYDPLAELARSGRMQEHAFEMAVGMISEMRGSLFKPIRAGATAWHEAGATMVQETALVLASISEYLVRCVEAGASVEDVVASIHVAVPISTSYLPEIARLRALRLLIPQVLKGFLGDGDAMQLPIHAETSRRQMTRVDPASNLLRATTEAASAVLGGCDVLVVHPLDVLESGSEEFGLRLARNLQHVLRHEARLGFVSDPSAGSYYLERLADAIAQRAWGMFQQIEAQGGLIESLKAGSVQEMMRRSRELLEQAVAEGKRSIVGTNVYPDPEERPPEAQVNRPVPLRRTNRDCGYRWRELRRHMAEGGALGDLVLPSTLTAEPIERFRESEQFEAIRREVQRLPEPPRVLILPIGEPAIRSWRSELAANVVGSVGLTPSVSIGYEDPATAVEHPAEDVDILIIAASRTACAAEELHQIKAAFSPRLIGIVGNDQEELEVDFRLTAGENMLVLARHLLERLTAEAEA